MHQLVDVPPLSRAGASEVISSILHDRIRVHIVMGMNFIFSKVDGLKTVIFVVVCAAASEGWGCCGITPAVKRIGQPEGEPLVLFAAAAHTNGATTGAAAAAADAAAAAVAAAAAADDDDHDDYDDYDDIYYVLIFRFERFNCTGRGCFFGGTFARFEGPFSLWGSGVGCCVIAFFLFDLECQHRRNRCWCRLA